VVRILTTVKKLDDRFGSFLVQIDCQCGQSRVITPKALAMLVGWTATLESLVPRMRCPRCGSKGKCTVVAIPEPQPRGFEKDRH
jgi:hypothetical protein